MEQKGNVFLMKLPNDWLSKLISFFCSLFVIIGITQNLGAKSGAWTGPYQFLLEFMRSFQGYSIASVIWFALLYYFFLYSIGKLRESNCKIREIVCAGIPALWLGFFMALGDSFRRNGTWDYVFGNVVQVAKSGLYAAGYGVLFFFVIYQIYLWLDRRKTVSKTVKCRFKWLQTYITMLEKRPFLTSFLTMLILYLPFVVLSYPGILMGDSYNQIVQAYNLEDYEMYFDFISEDVKLNNHHPVVHTLLIHVCLRIGTGLFGDINIGLFLYCLLQLCLVLAVLSKALSLLANLGVSVWLRIALMVYYTIHPRISNYMFLVTKDIISSAFLLLLLICLYQTITHRAAKKDNILFALSILGTILFRNDGIYIIVLTMIGCILFCQRYRKKFACLLFGAMVFSTIWNSVLLPVFQITPTGRREMLSIFVQQTARYVRDMGDEVTEEERQAIDAVLEYEKLAEVYDPMLADPVKKTFREKTATSEDLINYFKVWFQMFLKHPGIYFEATLHHKYDMFYFESGTSNVNSYEWSEHCMGWLKNVSTEETPLVFSYPEKLDTIRNWYYTIREEIWKFPIIEFVMVAATYIDLFLLWFFYGVRRRDINLLVLTFPMIVQLLLVVAGPTDANYFRYVYPLVMQLPIMIILGIHEKMKKEIDEVRYVTKK